MSELKQRMANPAGVLPGVTTAVKHLTQAIQSAGVAEQVLELVHLRVSQINGCTACVYYGTVSAERIGLSVERMLAVPVWRESPLFDDAERAALALAEAMTRLADRPGSVSDEIWDEVAGHFEEQQLAADHLAVAAPGWAGCGLGVEIGDGAAHPPPGSVARPVPGVPPGGCAARAGGPGRSG